MIQIPVEHRVDPSWVPETPLESPTAGAGLVDVFLRRYLLRLIVRKEIRARYSGSLLGVFWSYVQPAIHFGMYFLVIGGILGLHKSVPVFGLHMFAGFVYVHFFTETFSAGTRSIVANRSILKRVPMPREMFPVAAMLVSAFHVIPGIGIMAVVCVLMGWHITLTALLAGAIGFLIVGIWGLACALLFSAANVFFRDFSNIVSTLRTFITFSVPMVYPYSLVQQRFGSLSHFFLFNPIAEAVLLNQRLFWAPVTPHPAAIIRADLPNHLILIGVVHLVVALCALIGSQIAFSQLENKFAERL
jgi:ABC-2 type transport system permease protein